MTTADLHTLAGAYAVHALDGQERAAFERHLVGCDACEQEVAEFTATAGRLALASTVRARPVMREQVLQRITTVRQVSPGAAPLERVRRGALRGGALARWALAASVAAAVFGGTAVWQYERAQDASREAARAQRQVEDVAGVLAAPDAKSRSAKVAGGAGTLVVSASRERAVFVASGMSAPPRGKVYQLWFADDGGKMRSAGLMDPDRSSQAVLMQGAVDGASGIGITVEPAGGSKQPTSTPVALLGVPA
ncbi:anti-sigma factor [Streptomyces antibioticus]|uniref:Regulator of SigK n=1 Tax=Streptomyces antibioticus TaxID=1890 RepID=A0AAE6YGX1_STRAT|nr:anti-sigma factor [Streptomyces antibioticus]MBO7939251.1 anti-sigma factor [Streptomyces sp. S9]OOQ48250.1 anti-sigma factor [Streptomyces antibioticus]QIT48614.1 anti-sigma factor [Streptomyces antibioticus]